jgi:ABC-type dipeptide/oligopeptide/nickel transport system ATPase subunit
LKQQVRDDRKASEELKQIKDERTRRFMTAFEEIQSRVEETYTNMTKSSKHPLGGNAYLSLSEDSDDEPFKSKVTFSVKPANKRYLDLSQLSGGEKTIACLSLLFAINSSSSAPLFVMDEVDAALDNGTARFVLVVLDVDSITDDYNIVLFFSSSNSQLAQALQLCQGAYEIQLSVPCYQFEGYLFRRIRSAHWDFKGCEHG